MASTAVPRSLTGNARPGATAPPSTTAPGKSHEEPALAIHREDTLVKILRARPQPTCHSAPLHPDRSATHTLEPRLGQANARPPNPVPPPPAETVYNPGTAQYENLGYHNNGLPRPCRAGSGAPSYSTRRRPRPQVRELGVGGAGSWPVDGA
eukprot:scaffold95999_cov57-Phaeocystis_antarctica.AAC.2